MKKIENWNLRQLFIGKKSRNTQYGQDQWLF